MTGGLELRDVRVARGDEVLLAIPSLKVETSAVTVITGHTDAGKTLLAAVCCGRVRPSAGTIRVAGVTLAGGPAARRRGGLAATVADGQRIAGCTVAEALRLSGSSRAAEALRRFPLLERRRDVAAELLSGGEHQLLQVVCAWCAGARALVLDAPTTGLAGDVAADVVALAMEAAAAGSAVLWLDQSAPEMLGGTELTLAAGELTSVPAAV